MRGGRTALLIVTLVASASACTSTPTRTSTPTTTPTTTATPIPTPIPTREPAPEPTVLPFPGLSEQDLTPGRYDSSPPFAVDFTFLIPNAGWESAHIHDDFFDVMRLDGPDPRMPTRWVAWALPETIHGADASQPAITLAPGDAIDMMASAPGVEASTTSPFAFAGREGVQVDLRAALPGTRLFGGDDGDFTLDPTFDVRIGAVDYDPGLLLVMCLGSSGELEAGCADSQPIIDSVVLR